MKIIVLASGSSGNCTFIETKKNKIIVDAGLSYKRINEILISKEKSITDIDTILITHEHIDHISGLAVLLRKTAVDLYMSDGTYKAIMSTNKNDLKSELEECMEKGKLHTFKKTKPFYEKFFLPTGIEIEPIPLFHDAIEPTGYNISEEETRITLITDTGYVHNSLFPIIANSNAYLLEFNHDPEILMNSERPYSLKMRILSDHGHLSNEDAFVTLAYIMGEKTKKVFFSHISEECNLTEIIKLTKKKVFAKIGIDDSEIEYIVTSRNSTKEYEL